MNDERVIRLLEEVRDLQREHLEHYKEALRNQTESIRNQTEAIQMQRELHDTAKSRLRFVSVLIAVVLVLIVVSAWGMLRGLF
jgi:hypothetical protein